MEKNEILNDEKLQRKYFFLDDIISWIRKEYDIDLRTFEENTKHFNKLKNKKIIPYIQKNFRQNN